MNWTFDLAADEMRRQAAVLAAVEDWDPIEVLTSEAEASRMLYSNLDADQQRVYDELVAAGVLSTH